MPRQWPGKAGERPAHDCTSNIWPKPLECWKAWCYRDRLGPGTCKREQLMGSGKQPQPGYVCTHLPPLTFMGQVPLGKSFTPLPPSLCPSCKMRMIISNSESVEFFNRYKIPNTGPDIKRVCSKWELLLFLGRVEEQEFWWWAREMWLCCNIRTGTSPDRSDLGPVSTQPSNSYILK